jgi:pimeloyl-ACP methyl ester carboxylesterase
MKRTTLLLLAGLASFTAFGQDIAGSWYGSLKLSGIELRIVFHITKIDDGYTSTMDSPDQNAFGLATATTTLADSKLTILMKTPVLEYSGELKDGIITGNLKQNGATFPMNLSKKKVEKAVVLRPQEPKPPYPYYTEEVKFRNEAAGAVLAGTLTMPSKEGKYPVVIMISGSGPQNRNEELLGHKPFLVIADHLTRNGIAVLRYDDRGTAQSTGDFKTATSLDFASDVEAAIDFLKGRKEIDKKKIGLMGHSEGGLIAPMVAEKSKDVDFIILLAGPGLPGYKILLMQQELIARAGGSSESDIEKTRKTNQAAFDVVLKSDNVETLQPELTKFLVDELAKDPTAEIPAGMSKEDFVKSSVAQMVSPWMMYFLKYDPATSLTKVKCPVLAVNGSLDLQVPPKEDLAAIGESLKKAKNKKVTIIEFPGLNHLFQECKTGSPNEYASIEQTFSPKALDEITKWIQGVVK